LRKERELERVRELCLLLLLLLLWYREESDGWLMVGERERAEQVMNEQLHFAESATSVELSRLELAAMSEERGRRRER
jgi:hypothetical protein